MDHDQVEAKLAEFKEHLIVERRMAEITAATWVIYVRTALRKGGATCLAPGRVYGREEYAPGPLMVALLDGMAPLTKRELLRVHKAFAASQMAASPEAALQALIDSKDRDQAEALLAEFKEYMIKRKMAGTTISERVTAMRTAVRKLREKGFTALDIDRPKRPSNLGLEAIAKRSETPVAAKRRGPKPSDPTRDDYFIQLNKEGVSDRKIAEKYTKETELSITSQAVGKARRRRENALRTQ
jgi:hypothetical protein